MPFNQRLDHLHPTDDTWTEATTADRLAFHREAGRLAVELKRTELARGIGANGRRMRPRKNPRADGADGPVLTPHREDSRTARLMAAHCRVDAITLFWRSGHSHAQKLPWGTILGFHAAGAGKLPVRDVRLSKRGVGVLRDRMARWWELHHADRLRQVRTRRLAAEARERKRTTPKPARGAAQAAKAMIAKYQGLAKYLNPRGGGF